MQLCLMKDISNMKQPEKKKINIVKHHPIFVCFHLLTEDRWYSELTVTSENKNTFPLSHLNKNIFGVWWDASLNSHDAV